MVMATVDKVRHTRNGRALIIGAGPSVRHLSNADMQGPLVVAVNDGVVAVGIRADWFVTADPATWQTGTMRHALGLRAVLGLKIMAPFGMPAGLAYLRYTRRTDRDDWRMTADDVDTVWGLSSTHCAANLAVIAGCTHLVLVGCDGQTEQGEDGVIRTHFWQWPCTPCLLWQGEMRAAGDSQSPEAGLWKHHHQVRPAGAFEREYASHAGAWALIQEQNPHLTIEHWNP